GKEFGRGESVFRPRNILIRLHGLVSPNVCKPNCRPLPESKPLPSRMLSRSLEILRGRLTRARTGTQSQSTSGNLGGHEAFRRDTFAPSGPRSWPDAISLSRINWTLLSWWS